MKHPVFVFYQLTRSVILGYTSPDFYQMLEGRFHRRYMKSRSTRQNRGEDLDSVASCHPVARLSNSEPIVPCGLMAWSLFNDTYNFHLASTSSYHPIPVVRTRIAWKSDARVSKVFPQNFPNDVDQKSGNGSTRFPVGGASLDPRVPLSENQNPMVWMRPAPMPTFRKLYGYMQRNLHAGQVIRVGSENAYNTYSFKGSKSLVLSTTSFLGGKTLFLGRADLSIGVSSVVIALVTFLVQLHHPRPLGDHSRLTWNRHSRSRSSLNSRSLHALRGY